MGSRSFGTIDAFSPIYVLICNAFARFVLVISRRSVILMPSRLDYGETPGKLHGGESRYGHRW